MKNEKVKMKKMIMNKEKKRRICSEEEEEEECDSQCAIDVGGDEDRCRWR